MYCQLKTGPFLVTFTRDYNIELWSLWAGRPFSPLPPSFLPQSWFLPPFSLEYIYIYIWSFYAINRSLTRIHFLPKGWKEFKWTAMKREREREGSLLLSTSSLRLVRLSSVLLFLLHPLFPLDINSQAPF